MASNWFRKDLSHRNIIIVNDTKICKRYFVMIVDKWYFDEKLITTLNIKQLNVIKIFPRHLHLIYVTILKIWYCNTAKRNYFNNYCNKIAYKPAVILTGWAEEIGLSYPALPCMQHIVLSVVRFSLYLPLSPLISALTLCGLVG